MTGVLREPKAVTVIRVVSTSGGGWDADGTVSAFAVSERAAATNGSVLAAFGWGGPNSVRWVGSLRGWPGSCRLRVGAHRGSRTAHPAVGNRALLRDSPRAPRSAVGRRERSRPIRRSRLRDDARSR